MDEHSMKVDGRAAAAGTEQSAPWPTRTWAPFGMSISITPGGLGRDGVGEGSGGSGSVRTSCTGRKPAGPLAISWRRQVNSNPVLVSCKRWSATLLP